MKLNKRKFIEIIFIIWLLALLVFIVIMGMKDRLGSLIIGLIGIIFSLAIYDFKYGGFRDAIISRNERKNEKNNQKISNIS